MKENLKLGLILFVITAFAGLCLGFVNDLTAVAIAENASITSSDLVELLPGAKSKSNLEVAGASSEEKIKVIEAFEVQGDSELVGHIFKVTTKGFHGTVDLFVAISKEDKLSGIKIISHTETPGLGAKIVEDKFRSGFSNKKIDKGVNMVKTEAKQDNDVQAITGATVSSKAIGNGVNTAIKYYMKNIKGEDFDLGGSDATSGASEAGAEGEAENGTADDTSGASESQ
jgi:electron transport complex protein RnfG